MYRTIVLAYDGTVESRTALREGALLAKRCGAAVHLLAIVPGGAGLRLAEGVQFGAVARAEDAFRETLEEGLRRLESIGLKATAKLCVGDPISEIRACARAVKAELVVVGLRKQSAVQRWWGGSSGAYLADQIDCSLLIARSVVEEKAFDAECAAVKEAMPG